MKNFICKICQTVRRNKFWILATMFTATAVALYSEPDLKGVCMGYAFTGGLTFGLSLCKE